MTEASPCIWNFGLQKGFVMFLFPKFNQNFSIKSWVKSRTSQKNAIPWEREEKQIQRRKERGVSGSHTSLSLSLSQLMGKYMVILDAGVRIAARFHSHCPHTARLYYHPPSNSDDHHHHHHAQSSDRENNARVQDPTRMPTFGAKPNLGFDVTDFIVYSLVL